MQFTSLFTFILIAATAAASTSKKSECDLSCAKINFPEGQTALAVPTGKLDYLALGVGVQNYSCSDTGTYVSTGAVAELFDISCLYDSAVYSNIPDFAMQLWSAVPEGVTIQEFIQGISDFGNVAVLGQHYFIPNLNGSGAAQPKWDFNSSNSTTAFVVGAKVANLTAPTGSQDIDWLQLKNVTGDLAASIYRTDTRLGQPPANCTNGSDPISVKYVSQYWFYKNNTL
ncbi:hypothetical protein DL96DRAFT_1813988 [Flagelloscypha sp. PMI_526]|nr:hypothetical protein DL96DRAFT_1813988 [Flagelloscypha sp. PMI_526]